MQKTKLFILAISLLFLITGCDSDNYSSDTSSNNNYDTTGLNHISCTRDAYATDDNTKIAINIDIYYDNDEYLKILKSVEEVTSTDEDVLKNYEEAYQKIYASYKDIKYYDNDIVKTDNRVTSTTVINYGKVDMDKVLKIEGEEDNVKVVDGKIKLSDWKSFAKKYGTTCK